MVKRVYREDAEQRALIQWCDLTPMPSAWSYQPNTKIGDYLFAIPNGGARSPIEGARLVGLGVRAGVYDLFFSLPTYPPIKHGLYIEMKAPKPYGSKVSAKQAAFGERMQLAGYECVVCYGWDEARHAIQLYLQQD